MHTYFASAERTAEKDFNIEIETISNSEVMTGLLQTVSGLLAILDENRQIVALNMFLQVISASYCEEELEKDSRVVLKIPPVLAPVKLAVMPLVKKDGLPLLVHSHTIRINDHRFVLLFLQDITRQQQRAALERTFFHDINNMLGALVVASEYLVKNQGMDMAKSLHQIAMRLNKEVAIQRCISLNDSQDYIPVWDKYSSATIFEDMQTFFNNHPIAKNKEITYTNNCPEAWIRTDIALLHRVLTNMILNALEATDLHGKIKVWLDRNDDYYIFKVWNAQEIPEKIRGRIFQRNFSTKEQDGRGIGTGLVRFL
ncbi:MAG: ATP-binding protein [Calditrichaceae bacterium]